MERIEEITKEKGVSEIWTPLPGADGEYFAIHGNYIAGAQANRLTVWYNGEKIVERSSSVACNSYPVWKDDLVFWNDSQININSGRQFRLSKMEEIFSEDLGLNLPSEKKEGHRPVTCAWSPDACFFLLTMEGYRNEKVPHSKALLLDNEGIFKSILWEGYDFAPKAACIGKERIVLGTRGTTIFDLNGRLLATLASDLLPQRIHMAGDGSLLFIQTYETITLWNTGTWSMKGIVKGPWLNATLSPDGGTIYAIDFGGNLFVANISDTIGPMKEIPVPDPLATIDAGMEYIVASFAKGDAIRWVLRKELDRL